MEHLATLVLLLLLLLGGVCQNHTVITCSHVPLYHRQSQPIHSLQRAGRLFSPGKWSSLDFWKKPSVTLFPCDKFRPLSPPSTFCLSLIGGGGGEAERGRKRCVCVRGGLFTKPRYRIRSRLVKWITASVSQSCTTASLLPNDRSDTLITEIFTYGERFKLGAFRLKRASSLHTVQAVGIQK